MVIFKPSLFGEGDIWAEMVNVFLSLSEWRVLKMALESEYFVF